MGNIIIIVAQLSRQKSKEVLINRGYHSTYNDFVKMQLDKIDINQSVDALQREVYNLQSQLKVLQQSGLPLYPGQGASIDLWERSLNRIK